MYMKLPPSANNPDPATGMPTELKQYKDIAKDMLVDATESGIYMCGMVPIDLDDPFFDIFQCDPTFSCDSHIELEFYTSKIQPSRVTICCHCACKYDSPVELHTSLNAPDGPYSIVLPICEQCLANVCHVVVRGAR